MIQLLALYSNLAGKKCLTIIGTEGHESVFGGGNPNIDATWKFNLPANAKERLKVLKLLDRSNINAFSLFQSEESLMETMALRELDFREKES